MAEPLITDEMVQRALDAAGRRGGEMGPIRMRAALEAVVGDIELVAERDRLREFVDNLIAGRYFGGGWADKIMDAAKEARDA